MKITLNSICDALRVVFVSCFLLATFSTIHAQEVDRAWTTVGSAGTVDETDVGKVFFQTGKVQMGQAIGGSERVKAGPSSIAGTTQSAVIRYNVTAVSGLFMPEGWGPQLSYRFIANGANARAIAKLIEVDLASGTETVRLTIDSVGSAPGTGYRTDAAAPACGWRFDFNRKAYYVEATLTAKSGPVAGNVAGIHVIKIGAFDCR